MKDTVTAAGNNGRGLGAPAAFLHGRSGFGVFEERGLAAPQGVSHPL